MAEPTPPTKEVPPPRPAIHFPVGPLALSSKGPRAEMRISDFYRPFPRQDQFHCCPAKYRLFGGAAGPGKSKALLMEAVAQATQHAGVETLLLRRTFSELETSLLTYFRRDIPRVFYRSYNEARHVITWHNGSTTRFGYCRNESDVYQYQGAEFLFIGVDELTMFTLAQWQFLTSRNRCAVPGTFACMAGATNPGNIGHAWVKALWIDKEPPPGMERSDQYDPSDYQFIPARLSDNPIYATDAQYLKTLEALPATLRDAFLQGSWDVFAGQYFDRFDPERNTERAENIGFESWWPRWISMDWGFEHPAAVYWHASAPASQVWEHGEAPMPAESAAGSSEAESPVEEMPEDRGEPVSAVTSSNVTPSHVTSRVVTYRELVRKRLAPRALAQMIVDLSVESGGGRERIDAIYLSPDAFAHRTDEASIAEQMAEVFLFAGLPRPSMADNDRVGGWMLMYQMLESREWTITRNCEELIRVLPALVRDNARVEDVEKEDGDDAADAARYGLKSRVRTARPPLQQRLAEKVTSTDPTIRAIQARKAAIEIEQKQGPVYRRRRPLI
jgi:phage terminase large subunit